MQVLTLTISKSLSHPQSEALTRDPWSNGSLLDTEGSFQGGCPFHQALSQVPLQLSLLLPTQGHLGSHDSPTFPKSQKSAFWRRTISPPPPPAAQILYSQDKDTFVTLASLKEAETLVALEMGCDTMVTTAGTGWRATDRSPGNELCALGDSVLTPWGRVSRAVVESRCFIGVHGSRAGVMAQDSHMGSVLTSPSAFGKPHLCSFILSLSGPSFLPASPVFSP